MTEQASTVPPFRTTRPLLWRAGGDGFRAGERTVPEEMPIALSFNRTSHAVMMATPRDLHDFALGFALSEELVHAAAEVERVSIVPLGADEVDAPPGGDEADAPPRGIELRLQVAEAVMRRLDARRRHVAGPTGCGMCGLDSVEAALRPPRPVPDGAPVAAEAVMAAVRSLRPAQVLNASTRAVHAAGFWREADGLVALREDVGRHNALDKLHGALALAGRDASDGILLCTSRISVELVQKASVMRAPLLAAVSAPTALALRVAERCGMTLIAVAREDGFEVCCHPWRVRG